MQDLFPAVFAIVPVVLFAGVLRYRLFDIDRLLSRVLVYGLLVLAAGAVYLLAVVSGGGAGRWCELVDGAGAVRGGGGVGTGLGVGPAVGEPGRVRAGPRSGTGDADADQRAGTGDARR